MAQYIFQTDGDYVNFNGGGGLWRLARASNCIAWRFDQTGDLFFDVYDQQYIVKAENIAEVVIDGAPLAAASDFPDAITAVFTGLGGGSPGGGSYLVAEVTLTDAQIKALPTTSVEVIAAQGANKLIQIISAVFIWNCSAGALTNIEVSNNGAGLVYGNWVLDASAFSTIPQTASNQVAICGSAGAVNIITDLPDNVVSGTSFQANVVNASIRVIGINGSSGDFTGGNAANTLKIVVYYSVTDIS